MLELAGGNVDATAELLLGQAQATFKWQDGLDTLKGTASMTIVCAASCF